MTIRDLEKRDLPQIHAINEACLPAVNSLDPDALWQIATAACERLAYCDAGGQLIGFVWCLDQNADYGSENFQWFKNNYDHFCYVDRIALAVDARGQGVGKALYQTLIGRLTGRYPLLTCEVNERPPNPASMAFHRDMGFEIIGRGDVYGNSKSVAYFAREL